MIERYLIIGCFVVSHQIAALSLDEETSLWVKKNLPEQSQRTQRQLNLDPVLPTKDNVDVAVQWVSSIINKGSAAISNDKSKNKLNLDPSNFNIQDRATTTSTVSSVSTTPIEDTGDVPCKTKEGETGACVLYYLCNESNEVIADGSHLLDIRGGDKPDGLPCAHYLETCCKTRHLISNEENLTKQPTTHRPFKNQFDEFPYTSLSLGEPESTTATPECGWNNPSLFIFKPKDQEVADSGYYANFGDFPWMVAIMKKSDTDVWVQDNYVGGGTLIHPQVVITAYHVLRKVTAEQIKCRAGEWDTQTDKEQYKEQERNAQKIVKHERYYLTSLYNDIALTFLESRFDLAAAPHIGTACLSPLMPKQGTPCFSMGWGRQPNKKIYVNVLKKVRLPLVGAETCQNLLRQTRLRNTFQLHKSLTCAGGEEGIDTCTGDGGSSLVCPIGRKNGSTRYAMVGMSAFGIGCGEKDVPGVYVNIPHLSNWVDEKMAEEGYNNSTYSF